MKSQNTNRFLPAAAVRLIDGPWKAIYDKARQVTLPDVLDKFEKAGNFDNFRDFAEGNKAEHHGYPFHDGLIYETLRAAADMLGDEYDPALDARLDAYIDMIAKAQAKDPDGYLNTYTDRVMPGKRFGQNGGMIWWQHDMYNSGALFEAGVHHYLATGKKTLLTCAVKLANYEASIIGLPPKKNIVPGHSICEEALLKLYRLMKAEPTLAEELGADVEGYLALSSFWVYNRGVHKDRAAYPKNMMQYAQDCRPILEEDEAVGHAVRAVLFYEGAAAVAAETGDDRLEAALLRIWKNVVETKMHITGGVGSVPTDESFGYQYQILNDAYLETCAGVGLSFWAGYMYLLTGDGQMMDVFERSLFNNVLVGVSKEGTAYFYQNPLYSEGDVERWDWHHCPCCPPMLLKLIAALKTYIYSVHEGKLSVNLYVNSSMEYNGLYMEQKDGLLRIWNQHSEPVAIRLRIPGYAGRYTVTVDGVAVTSPVENGYLTVWIEGKEATVRVEFEMPILRLEGHPYMQAGNALTGVREKVVVQRGPYVYCAEGIDNDGKVDFALAAHPALTYHEEDRSITALRADGKTCRLIPYCDWNNRGKGLMRVWLKQDGFHYSEDLTGWDHILYRAYNPER